MIRQIVNIRIKLEFIITDKMNNRKAWSTSVRYKQEKQELLRSKGYIKEVFKYLRIRYNKTNSRRELIKVLKNKNKKINLKKQLICKNDVFTFKEQGW